MRALRRQWFNLRLNAELISGHAYGTGLPVAFGTSHVALLHRANLQKGQTALILGAAGGVGTAAVQVQVVKHSCSA